MEEGFCYFSKGLYFGGGITFRQGRNNLTKFTALQKVETENANNHHGEGLLSPTNFSPFPKNPRIAKLFMLLARFDELGSGILNVNKYIKAYSGKDNPQFIEGATIKTIIPTGGVDDEGIVVVNEGTIDEAIKGVTTRLIEAAKNRLIDIVRRGMSNRASR